MEVSFVNANQIKELKEKFLPQEKNYYLGTDYQSALLSFPGPEGRKKYPPGYLGEIIVSLQLIKKNAKTNNRSFQDEMTASLVHGILHLVGYDHKKDKDYLKMNKRENEIIKLLSKKLSLPDPDLSNSSRKGRGREA